jgi:DNA-binding SARP family transcriptional activator
MRLYYLAGDRTAALRHYERCVEVLANDLGVKPTKSTTVLYEQIRADHLDVLSVTLARDDLISVIEGRSLVATLGRLKQLHVALVDVQCRLQQEIQSVELTLESDR